MYEIRKTALAETDLEDIWLYTFNEWGETQADHYYDELIAGINQLSGHPEMGKNRDNIKTNCRSLQIEKHLVFYQFDGSVIRIIRVLHERMLPAKHL